MALEILHYRVATGVLRVAGTDDHWQCYSGAGQYRDKPREDWRVAQGPIPAGLWRVVERVDGTKLGPCALRLEPAVGTVTHGRSGFYIHGDNFKRDHSASSGCIIAPPDARNLFASWLRPADPLGERQLTWLVVEEY